MLELRFNKKVPFRLLTINDNQMKSKRNLIFRMFGILFVTLFTFHSTAQTTYYVDNSTGNDSNNGTSPNSAWKTLAYVSLQYFNPGDSILLKRGEVFSTSLKILSSGTQTLPITVSAYGNNSAKPKIDVADSSAIYGLHIDFQSYVTFEHIEVTGNSRYGIWIVGGTNNIIQDCHVHHISVDKEWHGIMLNQTTANLKILRNEISHCGLEGIYGSSVDIEIAHNYIHHINLFGTVGDCIQLDLKAKRFHIHNNIFDRSMTTGGKGAVVCSDTSSVLNGVFEYNTVICAPGDNFGFSAPGLGSVVRYNTFKGDTTSQFAIKGPHLIHHNIFDTYQSAFDFNIASSQYKVYNNIFKNISNYIVFIPGSNSGDRYVDYEFKNNISDNTNFSVTSNGLAIRSHNIYTEGTTSDPYSMVVDPMFVAEDDYHLKSSSPAINRGTPVGLSFDFEGNPIDNDTTSIGIYEYTGPLDSVTTDYPTSFQFNYNDQVYGKVLSSVDASATTDLNNSSLNYSWVVPEGFAVQSLSDTILSYIPPKVSEATRYPIILNIFDGHFFSSDTIEVEVVPFNPYNQRLAVDTATASGYDADTRMPMTVLDDDITTRWAHEGDGRWIMFELTEPGIVDYVEMSFFRGTTRQSYFDIEASNDGITWTALKTGLESCGFTDETEAFIDLANDSLIRYKYVRILGHQNSSNRWNSYGTVHLYGVTDTSIYLSLDYKAKVAGLVASSMDASGTFVKFKEELSFNWSLPEGFEAQDTTSSVLNYLPPAVEQETIYTVKLTVNAGIKKLEKEIELSVEPYNSEAALLLVDTVFASGYDLASNMPMNVLDDDISTRWSDEGDKKWIMLKLKYPSTLSHFEMSFFRGTSRFTYFEIYASSDSLNWDQLLLDGVSCGFSNNIEIIGNKGNTTTSYNYVMVVGRGNSSNLWNSYSTLKPYGKKETYSSNWDQNDWFKKIYDWYKQVKLYPNPAREKVNIILKKDAKVKIVSLSGTTMYNKELNQGNHKCDVSNWYPGLYFAIVKFDGGGRTVRKVIVR